MGKKFTIEEAKERIEKLGCKLISSEWNGADKKYDFRCSCGNTFNRLYCSVIGWQKLNTCRECTNKIPRYNSIAYEQAKEVIEKLDCKLLCNPNQWKGTQEKYDFQCSCGEVFNRRYAVVSGGSVLCLTCSRRIVENARRLDYKEVKYYVEIESESGCKLVSQDYKNNTTNMVFMCKCGNLFETDYVTFKYKNKHQCEECTNHYLRELYGHTFEYVKQYIESNNCKLLSSEYINSKEHLQIQCLKCNHVFPSTFHNFQITKHKCPMCAIKASVELLIFDIEYVKNYIENEGYKLLSEYTNCDTDLKLMCPKGHIFYMDFYHFKNRGQRCKVCFKLSGRSGENSGTWKGGITSLQHSMREYIKEWTKESMKKANYICQITGKKGCLNVHHTYPFHKILEETILELDLELKPTIGEYSQEEIENIKILIRQKHIDYDCSFVMIKPVHIEFHKMYGYKNTTREQLDEFISKYKKGEMNII